MKPEVLETVTMTQTVTRYFDPAKLPELIEAVKDQNGRKINDLVLDTEVKHRRRTVIKHEIVIIDAVVY